MMKNLLKICLNAVAFFVILQSAFGQCPEICTDATDGMTVGMGESVCIKGDFTGSLTIMGGEVCVDTGASWTLTDTLSMDGGSLTNFGSISDGGDTLSIVLNGSATLLNDTTGSIALNGSFLAGGSAVLNNAGSISSSVFQNTGSIVNNDSTGVINADLDFVNEGDFENDGTINLTCSDTMITCQFTVGSSGLFDNLGTVNVNGSGSFEGTTTGGGAYNFSDTTGTVTISTNYRGGGIWNLGGDLLFDIGDMDTITGTFLVMGNSDCNGENFAGTICDLSSTATIQGDFDSPCNAMAMYTISCALPVTFGELDYVLIDHHARLQWMVYHAENLERIEVLASTDGVLFHSVQQIETEANFISRQFFSNKFLRSSEGQTYYQLKFIDLDGQIDQSETIVVPGIQEELIIFPNPLQGDQTLQIYNPSNQQALVGVYDSAGRKLTSVQVQPREQFKLELSQYPSQMYFLEIVQGNDVKTMKLIK